MIENFWLNIQFVAKNSVADLPELTLYKKMIRMGLILDDNTGHSL